MSALGAAACTSSTSSAPAAGAKAAAHGPLEQTRLRVGIPRGEIGALPVYAGVDKGYFKAQGIDVAIDDGYASYEDALKALGAGKIDVVYDDYVHAILAQAKGDYRLQLVAEGYSAGDGSVQVLSKPTASSNEAQLRTVFGAPNSFLVPKAGTSDENNAYTVPTVMLMTRLPDIANSLTLKKENAPAHLKPVTVGAVGETLTATPDPNLAAVEPEPYFSFTTSNDRVLKLMDLTRGSTKAMPMGGYFAKQDLAVTDTNLFAAFTAGLNQGKAAASQRAAAMAEFQAHYGSLATATVAAGISFGTFPTTVSVDRVGRVLTLMQSLDLAPYYNIDTMMPPDAQRGGN
ncbi:MAG: ABC transporter substrate-binding protein [Catenulispora sp.]